MEVISFYPNTINSDSGRTNQMVMDECRKQFGWNIDAWRADYTPETSIPSVLRKVKPDWAFGLADWRPYERNKVDVSSAGSDFNELRSVRRVEWGHDLHAATDEYIDHANKYFDLYLLRVREILYSFPTYKQFWEVCASKSLSRNGSIPPQHWIEDGYCVQLPPNHVRDRLKIPNYFFPNAVDTDRFKPSDTKDLDVVLIGTYGEFYPLRNEISKSLLQYAGENKWRAILSQPPPPNIRDDVRLDTEKKYYVGEKYAEAISRSKVFIFDCGFGKYPVCKFFETMASGTLAMADTPVHAEELGFVDGETFVSIDRKNWKEKLRYYLDNDSERERICRNALKLIQERHSVPVRARDLKKILEGELRKCQ